MKIDWMIGTYSYRGRLVEIELTWFEFYSFCKKLVHFLLVYFLESDLFEWLMSASLRNWTSLYTAAKTNSVTVSIIYSVVDLIQLLLEPSYLLTKLKHLSCLFFLLLFLQIYKLN